MRVCSHCGVPVAESWRSRCPLCARGYMVTIMGAGNPMLLDDLRNVVAFDYYWAVETRRSPLTIRPCSS
jgi:hypothetical protein